MRINTNILSLNAQRNLANTSRTLSRAMQRLSSGQRVNTARDDAAGMAIGLGLQSQRRGMIQAIRNLNDSRGFLSTAEGALETQTQIVQRMRELAMQAANGALSDESRAYLNNEVQQLLEEFNRITTQTQFNGVNLLDGSLGTKRLQAGAAKGHTIDFSITSMMAKDVFSRTTYPLVGTGSFEDAQSVYSPYGLDIVARDINGDGKLDLVGVGGASNDLLGVSLGNGDGTFAAPTTTSMGSSILSLALADINGDGKLDAIGGSASFATAQTTILLGNGNGTFQARTTVAGLAFNMEVKTGDFNGDGNIDLLSPNLLGNQYRIYLGNGNSTFQAPVSLAMPSPFSAVTGDWNGDGKLDFTALSQNDGGQATASVFMGNGNGTFQTRVTYALSASVVAGTSADFNGDGRLDLVTANFSGGLMNILIGNGNGTFQTRVTFLGDPASGDVEALDFNGDGSVDLVTVDSTNNTFSIFIGNGNGTFQTRVTAAATSAIDAIGADLNDDGASDLVIAGLTDTFVAMSITAEGDEGITGLAAVSIATQSEAEDMLDVFDDALAFINAARSNIGALQSRLNFAESVAQSLIENLSSAESQVMDADYSIETADFSRLQILQQAGVAVLGQANTNAKLALKLLENI